MAYGSILSPEKQRANRLEKKGSMHANVLDLWTICVEGKHKKGGFAFSLVSRDFAVLDLEPLLLDRALANTACGTFYTVKVWQMNMMT